MKKLISLALAVVMIMCLSTAAFAVTVNAPGNYTADVTGNYVANVDKSIVYSVDITWSDLEFTYHENVVWDPETLSYSETAGSYWEGEGTITITNRSNTDIIALPKYSSANGYSGSKMYFSNNRLKVASAESGTAKTATITVSPSGFLPEMDEAGKIGTVTLTIEKYSSDYVKECRALIADAEALMNQWTTAGGSTEDESYIDLEDRIRRLSQALTAYEADGDDGVLIEVQSQNMMIQSLCNTLKEKLKTL